MSAKMDEPEEFFGSIEDAEAFAKEAYRKAAEYLQKGNALAAENATLRAKLRDPVVGTEVEALRNQNKALIEENRALLEDLRAVKTALRWVFLEENILAFAKHAIPAGSRKDFLMRNMEESKFVLNEDGKSWVIFARKFWREINYCVGMINPERKRNRRTNA